MCSVDHMNFMLTCRVGFQPTCSGIQFQNITPSIHRPDVVKFDLTLTFRGLSPPRAYIIYERHSSMLILKVTL